MFARLYNVAWSRTGRDRPVLPMTTIRLALDAADAATSDARTDFRYIKRGVLQLPGVASSQDYRANYLIYSNDNVHYFGAWVDSIEWASAGSFAVNFTDDLFTTFASRAIVEGYVTRKIYTTPSGEAPGDHNSGDRSVAALWGISLSRIGINPVIVYINAATETKRFYKPRGIISTPTVPILLQTTNDFSSFARLLYETDFDVSQVVGAFVVPSAMVDGVTTGRVGFDVIGDDDIIFDYIEDSGLHSPTVNMFSAISGDDALLLNSHDAELSVRLGQTTVKIPLENIDSGVFQIVYSLSPIPSVTIIPSWRNDISPYDNGVSYGYSDFPQLTISASTYQQWAIKNALPALSSAALGALTRNVAMLGHSGLSLLGIGVQGLISNMPPELSTGAVHSVDAAGRASVAIQLTLPKNRTRAIDFYKQFGYPCGHREVFDFAPATVTDKFSFYQSTDNIINGTMPAHAKDEIDEMLKAGVRCWNTIQIGDY